MAYKEKSLLIAIAGTAFEFQALAPNRPQQRSWAWHSTLLPRECWHSSDFLPWLSATRVFAAWIHVKDLHKPWPWACLPACWHYLIMVWGCSLRKCASLPSKAFSTDRDGALVNWEVESWLQRTIAFPIESLRRKAAQCSTSLVWKSTPSRSGLCFKAQLPLTTFQKRSSASSRNENNGLRVSKTNLFFSRWEQFSEAQSLEAQLNEPTRLLLATCTRERKSTGTRTGVMSVSHDWEYISWTCYCWWETMIPG